MVSADQSNQNRRKNNDVGQRILQSYGNNQNHDDSSSMEGKNYQHGSQQDASQQQLMDYLSKMGIATRVDCEACRNHCGQVQSRRH